jgi:hypothetical protein
MLQILGSEKRLCNGITRRDLLHVGGIGALGLGLGDAKVATAATASGLNDGEPNRAFLFSCLDRLPSTKRLTRSRWPPPKSKAR